jgi:hypothetical protein
MPCSAFQRVHCLKEIETRTGMIKSLIGIIVGAAIGFGYYKLVGCSSGTCPITSNPYISMLWGAVMGAFLSGV